MLRLICSLVAMALVLVATLNLIGGGKTAKLSPSGWYYAGSNVTDEKALGGFGPCDNFPKKCANDFPGTQGQLSFVAYPAVRDASCPE
jgi:hypothetical protein